MRILLLSQYYPPETGAAQQRLSDLARLLCSFGHEVTVLTSMPNYPRGKIFQEYKGLWFLDEHMDGIRILRGWAWVSKSRGLLSRLLNYFSFALVGMWVGIRHARKQDVIVVESPPLFLGITGIILSRLWSAPLIFNVSDLWPESAVSMGILRNPVIIRMATALENWIYRNSYTITGQTEGIVENIRERTSGIPVELITNGVDPGRFDTSSEEREKMREQFGFRGCFVAGYTGLHGLAQGLETILDAAGELQNSENKVMIAFFGDGPEKRRLEVLAEKRKLSNVRFFPSQPAHLMPAIFSCIDAAVIPLKNIALFKGALPSKLFECMGAGLPIVLAIDGEARRLVEQANGGICVPPENPSALADAIRTMSQSPNLCHALGENARRYVIAHYDRRELARRFAELLPRKEGKIGISDNANRTTSLDEIEMQTEIAAQKGD